MLTRFGRAELQKLFEPVIEDIDAMVTDQITRARRKRVREGQPGGNGIKVSDTLVPKRNAAILTFRQGDLPRRWVRCKRIPVRET